MRSMTGIGESTKQTEEGVCLQIEIRTYNKKQLDIKCSLPNEISGLEYLLRKRIQKVISRGTVNVKVNMKYIGEALYQNVNIDKELAATYLKKANLLQDELNLPGYLKINDILRMPNVIKTGETNYDSEDMQSTVLEVLDSGLDNLNQFREKEGKNLAEDFNQRIDEMYKLIEQIQPLAEKIPEVQKEKLFKRIQKENLNLTDNEERLYREMAIFSERCDVTEELTRLKSHFEQFKSLIKENQPVGRKLEFLNQEIQREINTLGVKAAHCEISKMVVSLKTEAEKIKEQIQNIE